MTPRTPRGLVELRTERARLCSAKVEGRRCSMPWSVSKWLSLDDRDETVLCTRHARAAKVTRWTADEERRELKYLRQMQLNYDRMMRGSR